MICCFQVVSDYQLVAIVGILVTVDVTTFVIRESVDPQSIEITTTSVEV